LERVEDGLVILLSRNTPARIVRWVLPQAGYEQVAVKSATRERR
jgi:hypothetical protein